MEADAIILLSIAFAVGVVAGLLPVLIVLAIFVITIVIIFAANGLGGALFLYVGVFMLPGYVPGYIVGALTKRGYRKRRAAR